MRSLVLCCACTCSPCSMDVDLTSELTKASATAASQAVPVEVRRLCPRVLGCGQSPVALVLPPSAPSAASARATASRVCFSLACLGLCLQGSGDSGIRWRAVSKPSAREMLKRDKSKASGLQVHKCPHPRQQVLSLPLTLHLTPSAMLFLALVGCTLDATCGMWCHGFAPVAVLPWLAGRVCREGRAVARGPGAQVPGGQLPPSPLPLPPAPPAPFPSSFSTLTH